MALLGWSCLTGWHPSCSSAGGSVVQGMKDVAHMVCSNPVFHISRRKWLFFVVDPSEDCYYHWLAVIAVPVLYNWCLLVAR